MESLTLSMVKNYIKEAIKNLGIETGSDCRIVRIERTDTGGAIVTFEWTDENGITQRQLLVIKDSEDDDENGINLDLYYTTDQIEKVLAEFKENIEQLFEAHKEEDESAIEQANQAIEAYKENVTADLTEFKESLMQLFEAHKEEDESAIEQANQAIEAYKENVTADLTEFKESLQQLFNEHKTANESAIEALEAENDTAFEQIQQEIDTINNKINGVWLDGTLAAGETTLTLSDERISENSIIDIYTNIWGVVPTDVTVDNGSLTLVFEEALDAELKIKIEVR